MSGLMPGDTIFWHDNHCDHEGTVLTIDLAQNWVELAFRVGEVWIVQRVPTFYGYRLPGEYFQIPR